MKVVTCSYTQIGTNLYKNYLNIHYTWQTTIWYGHTVERNNSIFYEPGVYGMYLNFDLFYILYMEDKIKKSRVITLTIAIISTFSTTGYILAIIMLTMKFLIIKTRKVVLKLAKFIIIPLLLIASTFGIMYSFNQKVIEEKISYDIRNVDYKIGYETFIEKPIVGTEFMNYDLFEEKAEKVGNSNSLITMLFQMEIIGTITYLLMFIGFNYYLSMYYS